MVTNSIPVADVFYRAGRPDQTVVLTGGTRTPSDALVGPVAVAAIGTLHLDMLFLGVHGMSERAGYTTPNLMEADVNRALVEAAERLVVLADHTKWGTVGISSIVAAGPRRRRDHRRRPGRGRPRAPGRNRCPSSWW